MNELQLAGLKVLQFTYDQLVRTPGRSMATLGALLEATPPEVLRSDRLAG